MVLPERNICYMSSFYHHRLIIVVHIFVVHIIHCLPKLSTWFILLLVCIDICYSAGQVELLILKIVQLVILLHRSKGLCAKWYAFSFTLGIISVIESCSVLCLIGAYVRRLQFFLHTACCKLLRRKLPEIFFLSNKLVLLYLMLKCFHIWGNLNFLLIHWVLWCLSWCLSCWL